MFPRVNFEMSEEDLKTILDACKSVPCIQVGGYTPSSPQANVNRAWAVLSKKMGFDSVTVKAIPGKGSRFFTAVVSENDQQREERLERERKEAHEKRINELKSSIEAKQDLLRELEAEDI